MALNNYAAAVVGEPIGGNLSELFHQTRTYSNRCLNEKIRELDRNGIVQECLTKGIDPARISLQWVRLYSNHDVEFPIMMFAQITPATRKARAGKRLPIPSKNPGLQMQGHTSSLDRGHILGDALGGPNFDWNFFPQEIRENRYGIWRGYEQQIEQLFKIPQVAYVNWFCFVCHNSIIDPSIRTRRIRVGFEAFNHQHELINYNEKPFDYDFDFHLTNN